jgi:hypothetical protein
MKRFLSFLAVIILSLAAIKPWNPGVLALQDARTGA